MSAASFQAGTILEMQNRKIDSKRTMLLHSEAKVEFYAQYLKRYLRILSLSPSISEINIFDVFCGTGIYENGKKGSPIVAYESITQLREQYGSSKTVNLIVNDSEPTKLEAVRNYIESSQQRSGNVEFHNLGASEMFDILNSRIESQTQSSRNLVFIDPYGYKEIYKSTLETLLRNGRTEVILFLPISHMRRFTGKAIESDEKPYEPLKRFVTSFLPAGHPIQRENVPVLDYINYVSDALSFGKHFTASYYIERDESNYYALFFVSSHIYGFEKILEVKWALDENNGHGFNQPDSQGLLFSEQERSLQRQDHFQRLSQSLEQFLSKPRNNREIYEHTLRAGYLPKHASEVLNSWQSAQRLSVVDYDNSKACRNGNFYLTWERYKSNSPKAIFRLQE